ncbi:MAG: hypothetical protein IJV82_06440 [Oscillospiraceae bacterium]|nr:hypothetical protein [Oscillospiraceae bacterium]
MEREDFITGYCRSIDQSRMVAVITEDGRLLEADCQYETCPHTQSCPIAQKIEEISAQRK